MNKTYDTQEASEYLKISVNTLANWRNKNLGPMFYSPAGKVIYYQEDLDNWIKKGKE